MTIFSSFTAVVTYLIAAIQKQVQFNVVYEILFASVDKFYSPSFQYFCKTYCMCSVLLDIFKYFMA
jgi:hypothetical protein